MPSKSVPQLQPPDAFASGCPSRTVVQHLTGRWGALTMAALLNDTMRFGELRRRIQGISDRMLSQTLGQLERDGMVLRQVQSTIPPNVEYSLTELGLLVAKPLGELIELVEDNLDQVSTAQLSYDDAS